jgi:CheY-like chemotaxis protein
MTSKKILVIDNEPCVLEVIQICLETMADWQAIAASSGAEGIKKAQSEQPDAILLDLIMPEMDGITTFKKLQENQLTRQIPVIFITAKESIFGDLNREKLGGVAAIAKPFNPLELTNQIADILKWQFE